MKRTLWGLMILGTLFTASSALADYKNYDARGNFLGWIKSPYSTPPWQRTGSMTPGASETVESTDEDDSYTPWTGAVAGGAAFCAGGFDASYSAGYGLEGNFGLKLDQNWALLLSVDVYSFISAFSGWYANQIDLLPTLRFTFGDHGVRPYLFAGVGGNENLMVEEPYSLVGGGVNLSVAGGVGIDIPASKHVDVFIQGKYVINYSLDGNFSYYPVCAGLQFN
jgi:hypothetical protein